jgi:serine/threonine protein kinase
MGVVYEAFDEANGAPVALKLLPVVSPEMLLRFKREFRAVADVRHPNLVRLGDLVAEGSQWFFTMELVQGIDLMSYVRGVEPAGRPSVTPRLASDAPTPIVKPGEATRRYDPATGLPVGAVGPSYREDRLRPVMAQLARALSALHAAGCVHRDVKPSNVLVTAEGRAVLLDFGLVSAASIETTQSGAGTPEYMAPEQVAMQPVNAAADWYAFGVILFELCTGRLPFEGLPHEILYRKQHGRAPRVAAMAPGVPPDLALSLIHL